MRQSVVKFLFNFAMCSLMATPFIGCNGDEPDSNTDNEIPDSNTDNEIKGHEYVDLGLSVKWATCNVGASSPTEYGNYYAWGETETKKSYTEENYQTFDKSIENISGTQYDVAHKEWGGSWRMPTLEEISELVETCDWNWTREGGKYGYKVTGPNGNSIFLAAGGYRQDTGYAEGEDGYYWSSTLFDYEEPYVIEFSEYGFVVDGDARYNGFLVRPVSD